MMVSIYIRLLSRLPLVTLSWFTLLSKYYIKPQRRPGKRTRMTNILSHPIPIRNTSFSSPTPNQANPKLLSHPPTALPNARHNANSPRSLLQMNDAPSKPRNHAQPSKTVRQPSNTQTSKALSTLPGPRYSN
jgi:hypothetical protein